MGPLTWIKLRLGLVECECCRNEIEDEEREHRIEMDRELDRMKHAADVIERLRDQLLILVEQERRGMIDEILRQKDAEFLDARNLLDAGSDGVDQ